MDSRPNLFPRGCVEQFVKLPTFDKKCEALAEFAQSQEDVLQQLRRMWTDSEVTHPTFMCFYRDFTIVIESLLFSLAYRVNKMPEFLGFVAEGFGAHRTSAIMFHSWGGRSSALSEWNGTVDRFLEDILSGDGFVEVITLQLFEDFILRQYEAPGLTPDGIKKTTKRIARQVFEGNLATTMRERPGGNDLHSHRIPAEEEDREAREDTRALAASKIDEMEGFLQSVTPGENRFTTHMFAVLRDIVEGRIRSEEDDGHGRRTLEGCEGLLHVCSTWAGISPQSWLAEVWKEVLISAERGDLDHPGLPPFQALLRGLCIAVKSRDTSTERVDIVQSETGHQTIPAPSALWEAIARLQHACEDKISRLQGERDWGDLSIPRTEGPHHADSHTSDGNPTLPCVPTQWGLKTFLDYISWLKSNADSLESCAAGVSLPSWLSTSRPFDNPLDLAKALVWRAIMDVITENHELGADGQLVADVAFGREDALLGIRSS